MIHERGILGPALLAWTLSSALSAAPPPKPPEPPGPLPAALREAAPLRDSGEYAGAIGLLNQGLLNQSAPPDPPDAAALTFALAEATRLSGDPEEAARLFGLAAAEKGELSPYASYGLATCRLELGQPAEASAALAPCLLENAPSALRAASLRLSLDPLLRDHAPLSSLRASEALEKLEPRRRPEWRFRRAEALLALKRPAEAKALLAQLWREETESPWGRRAGLLFKRTFPEAKLSPADPAQALLLARSFLSGGRTADAWEVLQSLEGKKLPPPAKEGADLLRASVLYALRWNGDIHHFADSLRAGAGSAAAAQAADLKALWACLRDDDPARAEALAARLLASPLAKPKTASEVRFALGTLYYCRGEWARAAAELDAIVPAEASDTARAAAPYRAAWCVRKAGDKADALARMRRVAASAPPAYADPARDFSALWQEEMGDAYLAQAGWESLALGPGYWAAAAREALASRGKGVPPRSARAGVPPPHAAKDAEARLAELLALSGFTAFAAERFEGVYERSRKDPSTRFRFAQLLAAGGQVGRALAMARADFGDPELLDDLPEELAALYYPRPFRDRMPRLVPPLTEALVYAITKRESGFDPAILSPVGAVGLMQLMPDTAAKLALPGESLPAEEELVDPATNLRLGTAYLAQLWALLGREEAVIASYNAGEDRVGRWLLAFQATGEREFVAMIPYEETRLYTQRVLFDRRRYAELK